MTKLLTKANNDVLSHCQCSATLASLPDQLDCPWCGCGWLISCTHCRLPFTYARVVEVDTDYATYIQEDRRRGGYSDDDDPSELRDSAMWLEEMLADIPVDATVVYLDGLYLEVDAAPVVFDGLHAAHELPRLPHHEALRDPSRLRAMLGEPSYWLERALPEPASDD